MIIRSSHHDCLGMLKKENQKRAITEDQFKPLLEKLDSIKLELLRLGAALLPEEELDEGRGKGT